eukprot:CAMPEP_0175088740 /NCGR_PEP_ID=MMETSP0086_2-20121207/410_1 /TAXON_ID=136419 /ORGANISM="Unknown Unknown, Strain D1" /LENGTH=144 /DNA_ID=CAMNT_0016361195 /DNA_START=115 /DNA_END=549 /DNA_ORIENTATION=-
MMHHDCPRFGMPHMVTLNPILDAKNYDSSDEFKISFSFAKDRFLIPWITVTDGKGHYLNFVSFTFVYSGDYIRKVKWDAEYHTDSTGVQPEHVYLHYNWEEFSEMDTNSSLVFLVVIGFSAAVVAFGVVLYGDVYTRDPAVKKQ